MEVLTDILATFDPITLEEMSSIKLMNRIDTKFVTTRRKLMQLLDMARADYWAQDIRGERLSKYDTTYFDTDDFAMYRIHQSGHTGRQKMRFRTYVSSDLQFLEVKTKNNHGRTKKKRIKVFDMDLDDEGKRAFLAEHLRYDIADLQPAIRNNFERITLVNDMGPLVIIELKRDGLCYSPVLEMLRQLRIHPHGFSKYCMGSAMTNSQLPVNRFKPKLRDVETILLTES